MSKMLTFVQEFPADRSKVGNTERTVHGTTTPRPLNAFFCYRREKMRNPDPSWIKLHQSEISALLGRMWKDEPEEVKKEFHMKADKAAIEHIEAHPGYKFSPKQTKKVKAPLASKVFTTEKELSLVNRAKKPDRAVPIAMNETTCQLSERQIEDLFTTAINELIDPTTLEFKESKFDHLEEVPSLPSDILSNEYLLQESLNTDMLTRFLIFH
ncbi:uncharacterized protein B0P05DRAFT_523904 [Gilbertella persicaria]|uniref:uncharacterized protein n=1 Tax=Gilbertella persicaria TaxID=101096 RepID=UPI00221E9705|nr:uncharacterized protein B0P05DRAFT_523904 [Gilbertella persicaria]KAI8094911.1 hypothetical protein B0P05DRAFT_523904 [Gilbertella persicaria]